MFLLCQQTKLIGTIQAHCYKGSCNKMQSRSFTAVGFLNLTYMLNQRHQKRPSDATAQTCAVMLFVLLEVRQSERQLMPLICTGVGRDAGEGQRVAWKVRCMSFGIDREPMRVVHVRVFVLAILCSLKHNQHPRKSVRRHQVSLTTLCLYVMLEATQHGQKLARQTFGQMELRTVWAMN